MVNWKQLGIAFVALLIGGGFAFGGIASYAGIVDGGSSNQNQDYNTTMPSSNYQEKPFHLDAQEQRILAYQRDVVFVNGFYENQEQKQQLQQLQDLTGEFNGRIYVSLANSTSDSDVLYTYGLTEFPKVVVIGGNQQYQGQPISEVTNSRVSGEVCDAFRQLGNNAAKCLG